MAILRSSCRALLVVAVVSSSLGFGARAFSVLRTNLHVARSATIGATTSELHMSADVALEEETSTSTAAETTSTSTTKDEQQDLSTVDTMEIKRRLLDLVPRMVGTEEDYRMVESYVNVLEERFTPVQTLQFFNMATAGEWQLLFSTNLSGMPRPNFRLRELFQKIETNNLNGTVSNQATWDLAEEGSTFDTSGTFTIQCKYSINQGARMVVDLEDHVLELAKGSVVPKDVQALVGLLHRAIPKEMFDPNDHAMDTTYLDGDLRIVRMTGPRLEGVRDIFIRRGSIEINPAKLSQER